MAEKAEDKNQADDRGKHAAPKQIGVRQGERERRHAQDRSPDDGLAAHAIANRSAEKSPGRDGEEKDEEMELRALDREAEFFDQEKSVIARDAGEIEILRENERDQDAE